MTAGIKSAILGSMLITAMVSFQSTVYADDRERLAADSLRKNVADARISGTTVYAGYGRNRDCRRDRLVTVTHRNKYVRTSRRYDRRYRPKYYAVKRYVKPRRHYWSSTRDCGSTPVIVYLGDGRRLYQQRVKGASAYLQVYSKDCRRWVSIRRCPSIW